MFFWYLRYTVSTLQILLQEKLAGAFKYRQDHLTAGECSPRLASWWGGWLPPPQKPHSRFQPFT